MDAIASGVIQTCHNIDSNKVKITISKDVIDSGKYNFTNSEREEIIEILKKLDYTENDIEIKKIRKLMRQ